MTIVAPEREWRSDRPREPDGHETYVPNRFRFASGEFVDAGSAGGLYYFRNRYYDPDLRRWISEDPLGLEGGPNWYAYVGNDPINLADPWGLKEASPEGLCDIRVAVGSDVLCLVDLGNVTNGGGSLVDGLATLMSLGRPTGFPRGFGRIGTGLRGVGRALGRAWRTGFTKAREFAVCVADEARANRDAMQFAMQEWEAQAWHMGSRLALGAQYVAPSGAPGVVKFFRTMVGPVSRQPRYVVPHGLPRAGALVTGRAAVKQVLIRGATAWAVMEVGFWAGSWIGSAGVGAYNCLAGS